MRVLIVLHSGDPSGPALSLLSLAGALAARGASIETCVPADGIVGMRFKHLGVVHTRRYGPMRIPDAASEVPLFVREFFRQLRALRDLMTERQPELVLVATSSIPTALIASRSARIPTVVYLGEAQVTMTRHQLAKGLPRSLNRRLTRRLGGFFICCSDFVAESFGVRSRPHVVMEPRIAQPVALQGREEARTTLGIPETALAIAVIGSISHGRGQDIAIDAARTIQDRGVRAHVLIVGNPHRNPRDVAFLASLNERVRRLRVPVSFIPSSNDIGDIYAACDVVLNPARVPEGFGRVGFEAALSHRPFVAARVGAIPDYFTHNHDALLVDPDSPGQAAEQIMRLQLEVGLGDSIKTQAAATVSRLRARNRVDEIARILATALNSETQYEEVGLAVALRVTTQEVLTKLDGLGIKTLILRGPLQTKFLFGTESARSSLDVDVLVSPEQFPEAERALDELGFVPTRGLDAHDPGPPRNHLDSRRPSRSRSPSQRTGNSCRPQRCLGGSVLMPDGRNDSWRSPHGTQRAGPDRSHCSASRASRTR